jgi:hypothetical protein
VVGVSLEGSPHTGQGPALPVDARFFFVPFNDSRSGRGAGTYHPYPSPLPG